MSGTLYGIGVGPGDPDLIPLKALKVLQRVPLVFAPIARPGGESLALRIAAPHLTEGHETVPLLFAMRSDAPTMVSHWQAAATAIAQRLEGGEDGVFLTEGDPSLYSTFQHVAGILRATHPHLPIVTIPGVTSVLAVAAAAGVALTDADERLAVLPATYEDAALDRAFADFDTVVLMKVASAFDRVLARLDALGLTDGAVLVERCSQPGERVVSDVRTLRGGHLDYFSTMIVRTKR